MLVPLSWLKEYVDITIPTDELAAKLSASGSAVERIHHIGAELQDLVVGHVLEVSQHPNADRLRLAKVDIGTETLGVVCGAPNLAAGQHIAFARVGAHVPVNMHDPERQPFTLEAAKIRGITSQGMICSSAEMGLGEDHAGILVLPEDTNVGQSVAEALGYPQTVFDIEVTTNRADELAMIGLAREVGVVTGQNLRLPATQLIEATGDISWQPKIDSPSCYRLMTQALSVKIGPSPWWLQQYLSLAGMRPINNVVDITNFVMLEYGQPMHAYDTAKLHGRTLTARQAHEGEVIVTLDGTERKLTPQMLVIADEQAAVGVAGIMGGDASKIDESTQQIVLEAAVFDPVSIRRTANKLALRSEASKRFERLVDAEMTNQALARAADLLVKYAGAQALGEAQDVYPTHPEQLTFVLTQEKLNQYLGKKFTLSEAENILHALGFETVASSKLQGASLKESHPVLASEDGSVLAESINGDFMASPESDSASLQNNEGVSVPSGIESTGPVLRVKVPSWRIRDIEGEEDLIEEVVRIIGYDSLPIELPQTRPSSHPLNVEYVSSQQVRDLLVAAGWTEIATLSLTNIDTQAKAGLSDTLLPVANPLSAEWTHMRTSLWPGMLDAARINSRQSDNLKLFELSRNYQPKTDDLPQERAHLALLWTGGKSPEQAVGQVKGVIERVLGALTTEPVSYADGDTKLSSLSQAVEVKVGERAIGWLGSVSRRAQQAFDLPEASLGAELDIQDLLTQPQAQPFQTLPTFPAIEEDLSLLVAEEMPIGRIIDLIYQAGGQLVEAVQPISTYRSTSLGEGKKSPLFHIIFRAADRTLSSQELAEVRQRIVDHLATHNIEVRN